VIVLPADDHEGMRIGVPVVGAFALVAGTLTGCAADTDDVVTADPCARRIADAADAIDIDDQVTLLDEAMYLCRSLEEFTAGVAGHPGIMAVEPVVFLARRCVRSDIAAVRESPICDTEAVGALVEPESSVTEASGVSPAVPAADPVYLGETLDGRTVEIVPDADTPFVDGRPQVIVRMVDLAFSDGCDGLVDEREYWTARSAEPAIGDEASVYARHAVSLMEFIRCEAEQDPATSTSTQPSPSDAAPGDDGSAG
jgi:hypothetical protein